MTAKLARAMTFVSFPALTACSWDPTEPDPTPDNDVGSAPVGVTVNVTLTEHELTLSRSSSPASVVTFVVENQGSQTHELWLLETDLAPQDLPTRPHGAFDTGGDGFEIVVEIDFVAATDRRWFTTTVQSGSYLLLCNYVVREGNELVSHFHEGMVATFEVQ